MNTYVRLFGSGPLGVLVTAALSCAAWWGIRRFPGGALGLPHGVRRAVLAVALVGTVGAVVWAVRSLPVTERGRGLCEDGAYRWVRHPLYASLVSLAAPGFALFADHWVGLLWLISVHVGWHAVIVIEERLMVEQFGAAYVVYAGRTGRFVPRLAAFRGRS